MARFASYDGTQIGYRVLGAGPPLVCLPGGPGRTGEYFGDLGGLSRSRQLIMPDTRGTGQSADAGDPVSYRCDRLVGDVITSPVQAKVAKSRIRLRITTGSWLPGNIKMHARGRAARPR
jgi:pimeloyl-ACP methyl ester carboxylesterase